MFEIQLSVPAEKKNIEYLDDVIMKSLIAFGVEKAKAFHFALHEVFINSIQAYERNKNIEDSSINIRLIVNEKTVEATVIDHFGGGGDKEALLELETGLNPLTHDNGRGILLIEHLVDDFTWETKENGMFIVRISMELFKQKELC